jgi:predicted enzyme related to lactoylglutathione lyase
MAGGDGMTGRVVHFELPVDDTARAQAFYRDAFGWTIADVPGMDYMLVGTVATDEIGIPTEPGAINGGMQQRRDPVTGTVITVQVDDIESALADVERLGGKVVQGKKPVGPMGFTGYFSDPEGNVVGLWQDAGDA